MKKLISLFLLFSLSYSPVVFADVYPFEEEYSKTPTQRQFKAQAPKEEAPFRMQQSIVTDEDRATQQEWIEGERKRDDYYKYRTITFGNFGSIMVNLVSGVGNLYRGLFTEAFPEYGADLASIPAVSAEQIGKFAEIEKQVLFERDAKQRETIEFIESQQAPLTAKEQKLLKELRGKPISSR